MKKTIYFISVALIVLAFTSCGGGNKTAFDENKLEIKMDSFKDKRDGKMYKTVKIGTQTWMAENLAYKTSSGCWAYNNDQSNVVNYGYLFDWYTAKDVCPQGWHLPSDDEWCQLIDYLGGIEEAGARLKSIKGWDCIQVTKPTAVSTNISKFSALPGGIRNKDGSYVNIGCGGYWWTANNFGLGYAQMRMLAYDGSIVFNAPHLPKESGLSVRCIKNN